MFLNGHQFVSFGGGFQCFPCHQHLVQQSQEQCDCTEILNYWYGVFSCWKTCLSVYHVGVWVGPHLGLGGRGRKENRSLIRIFFSHTVSKFFSFWIIVIVMLWKGYSNALETWNFSNRKRTVKYLTHAFLRKWQMHESTGGSRGLSVCVTRALCADCSGTAFYGNKCHRIIK